MTTFPSFSVIIPCYNEEGYVGPLLSDIIRQTTKPREVIIADSRSSDRTVEVGSSYKDKLPLRIVTSDIRTPGAARNVGAAEADSEYLVFIDADVRLAPDCFEQLVAATDSGTIDYLTPLYSTPGHNIIDQLIIRHINLGLRLDVARRDHVPGIGCLLFIRRPFHEKLKGFDPHMAKGNDIDYLERLKTLRPNYKVVPQVVVEASNRRHIKDGRFISLLNYTPHRSRLGKYMVYPLLKKFGKEKKYGHF